MEPQLNKFKKNCSYRPYTLLTTTDQKPQNHKMLTAVASHRLDVNVMLLWLTLSFYAFCGFLIRRR